MVAWQHATCVAVHTHLKNEEKMHILYRSWIQTQRLGIVHFEGGIYMQAQVMPPPEKGLLALRVP